VDEVVTVADDFGSLGEIDEHISEHVTLNALDHAIIERPECPPELANKLRKQRHLGKHAIEQLAEISRRAVFDIETLSSYIINVEFEVHPTVRSRYHVRPTVLPWTRAERNTKQYLCLYVHRSLPGLRCKLAVARLDVDGDVRTILVTDHVCDRLSERAGILGSQVAYIGKSILRAGLKTWKQRDKKERLLEIVDFDGKLIGYCPIGSKRCGLHRGRATLLDDIEKIIPDQDRWRLKTFVPPQRAKQYIVSGAD